jgi:hypothetical protein
MSGGRILGVLLACCASVTAARACTQDCILFSNEARYPVVRLDAAAIDSIGRSLSDANVALIERIDEQYRSGRYGEPGSNQAKTDALAALIYHAKVAFDFVQAIAEQEACIYSTSEADLREAFTRSFRNPGIYPIMNLVDARAGFGRFCMKFEVEDGREREIEVSGEKMRAWTERIEIDGSPRPVVNIDMKTFSNDRVHVVYEQYSCGTFRTFDAMVRDRPVRVFTMEELEGQYVRKFGFHKPHAIVLWKSPAPGELEPPPVDGRFLGSAIYFPRLELDLPLFLPALGFDDLRKFEFPEPVLTVDATRGLQARDLEWVRVRKNDRFADWEGDGETPPFVNERFPDY